MATTNVSRRPTVGQIRYRARVDARDVLDCYGAPADARGVDVVRLAGHLRVAVFSALLDSGADAVLRGTDTGASIYVARHLSPAIRRELVAFELGRWVYHDYGTAGRLGTGMGYEDTLLGLARSRDAGVIYAQEFASAVLLPEAWFRTLLARGYSLADIARDCGVRPALVQQWQRHLGLA